MKDFIDVATLIVSILLVIVELLTMILSSRKKAKKNRKKSVKGIILAFRLINIKIYLYQKVQY